MTGHVGKGTFNYPLKGLGTQIHIQTDSTWKNHTWSSNMSLFSSSDPWIDDTPLCFLAASHGIGVYLSVNLPPIYL